MRTAGGSKADAPEAAPLTLGLPVLLAGNFNQTGKICLVAVGSNAGGGGSLVAQSFTDLTGSVPIASTSVMAQAGTLFADPMKARPARLDSLMAWGTLADDIACQLDTGQLALFFRLAQRCHDPALAHSQHPPRFAPAVGALLACALADDTICWCTAMPSRRAWV